MAGLNSLLFLKVLCDIESKKVVPSQNKELLIPNSQTGEDDSLYGIKIYMQDKFGVGGSPESKRYACSKCSCLFRRKRHLRQHMEFQCNHKCLGCSECYADICKSFKILSNESPSTSETLVCSCCSLTFQTQAGLSIHEEYHLQKGDLQECEPKKKKRILGPAECAFCHNIYSKRDSMLRHVRKVHKHYAPRNGEHFLAFDKAPPHLSKKCRLCVQKFKTTLLNRIHICAKFTSIDSLNEHAFDGVTYDCPACLQIFSSFLALKLHCEVHVGGKEPVHCNICDKTVSSLRRMDAHNEFHGRNTCTKCNVLFTTKLPLMTHHCGFTNRCLVCDKIFPLKRDYVKHLTVHPKPQDYLYKCSLCSKIFLKESYYRAHQMEHTGTYPFSCIVCDKKFVTYRMFRNHCATHLAKKDSVDKAGIKEVFESPAVSTISPKMEVSKGYDSLECENCLSTFDSDYGLLMHRNQCRLGVKLNKCPDGFECNICGKIFRLQHQVFIHMEKEHEVHTPYLFHCDFCPRGFYLEEHYKCHRISCAEHTEEERQQIYQKSLHTKQNNVKQYQCGDCGKKYFSEASLNDHVYSHCENSECPYICPYCGVGFARETYMNFHVEKCKVTDPRERNTFKCTVCGVLFRTEKTLAVHKKVHGKELKCDVCGEKFITKQGYHRHQQALCTAETAKNKDIRKPNKPPTLYNCPKCGRIFLLKSRFLAHVASHDGNFPYECLVCNRKFLSQSNLTKHKRKCPTSIKTENCAQSDP